jgi:hypothetical protein
MGRREMTRLSDAEIIDLQTAWERAGRGKWRANELTVRDDNGRLVAQCRTREAALFIQTAHSDMERLLGMVRGREVEERDCVPQLVSSADTTDQRAK